VLSHDKERPPCVDHAPAVVHGFDNDDPRDGSAGVRRKRKLRSRSRAFAGLPMGTAGFATAMRTGQVESEEAMGKRASVVLYVLALAAPDSKRRICPGVRRVLFEVPEASMSAFACKSSARRTPASGIRVLAPRTAAARESPPCCRSARGAGVPATVP
jgi:hypothetical protein